jgi:anaerobic magnesium-protoporphyrin IX monomethyl ester cyclase
MTDILLIQPPVRDFYLTAKRSIPYGLACIAASLLKHGFSVEILDGLSTSKSRNIPLPEEMNYLSRFYGSPDLSPFALFHPYKHFGYSFEHIGKQAKDSGAFLIGISSLFTAYSHEALHTARIVKDWHPSCKIVFGGHHPTALPEAVMSCSAIDFGFRGEGEASLPALATIL